MKRLDALIEEIFPDRTSATKLSPSKVVSSEAVSSEAASTSEPIAELAPPARSPASEKATAAEPQAEPCSETCSQTKIVPPPRRALYRAAAPRWGLGANPGSSPPPPPPPNPPRPSANADQDWWGEASRWRQIRKVEALRVHGLPTPRGLLSL